MPWTPLPDPDGPPPRRVGDDLDHVLGRLGGGSARATGIVFNRWADAVGPGIASHASPTALRGTTLTVTVDAPAYATQLRLMTRQLIARLTEFAGPGAVEAVDIRVRA
jgi:predicted nucleic acid-binding Zn ribbon protein